MKMQDMLKIGICFAILAVLISGCSQNLENAPSVEKQAEVTDTGVLSVASVPDQAQVYINGEIKGDTPLELDNFPVGAYKVAVRKDGYSDFEKSVTVIVGRREEVEAVLSQISIPAPAQTLAEENKSVEVKLPENAPLPAQKLSMVNISSSFVIYYDFKKALFTDITSGSPDVFSSNYGAYLYFTAMPPSKMLIIDKQIKDATKDDCANAKDTIANLYSGQTLCIKAKEGIVAAIGGNWSTKPRELEWVLFS